MVIELKERLNEYKISVKTLLLNGSSGFEKYSNRNENSLEGLNTIF